MRLLVFILLRPLLPWASRWVAQQEALITAEGRALTAAEQEDARRAGVTAPEKIHIQVVPTIQPPDHRLLIFASKFVKLIGPHTAGLTLRYGIYIREDCRDYRHHRELYIHEFVHVGQYERLGSIRAFLSDYLVETIYPGYPAGPLEQEAIVEAGKICSSPVSGR